MIATEYVVEALGGASIFKSGTLPTPAELRDASNAGSRIDRSSRYASGCG